jgi:hypothetical protein
MNTLEKRWSKRRVSRGVAMVEAGILAPIFAMMMMMTVYLGGVYEKKYLSVMRSRYYTWSYASNACSGSVPNASNGPDATQTQNNSDPCNQAQGGGQAQASLGMAKGYDQETWDYSPTYKFNGGGPKTVRTDGQVVCNEKQNGINVFSYLGNELGSMFGQISGGNSPCN